MDLWIRKTTVGDSGWIAGVLKEHWGGDCIISNGSKYYPQLLEGPWKVDGFIARLGERVGLLSYDVCNGDMEIVLLQALRKHQGIGTQLLDAAVMEARQQRCHRIHLTTTNDNVDGLRFYQRRGFSMCALHIDAMAKARQLKSGIPLLGDYEIPMDHEIELERILLP